MTATAVAAMAGLLVCAWFMRDWPRLWFYGSVGYAELKASALGGIMTRTGLLLAGGVGCWAVLKLMPNHDGVAAWAGRNSLAVYLLHGIAIKLLAAAGVFVVLKPHPWLVVAVAVLFVFILAASGKLLRPLMDYRWLWNSSKTPDSDCNLQAR